MDTQPPLVAAAREAAAETSFAYASDDQVGRLLAVLAAAVPAGARILELGTGTGVGTAWIVAGLGERSDVEVVTVESDKARAGLVRTLPWPPAVLVQLGDAVALLPKLGSFDLIFADAPAGKWEGLPLTVSALRPGGVLVVDDMTPQEWWEPEQQQKQAEVRSTLLGHPDLVSVELHWATGVILSVRPSPA